MEIACPNCRQALRAGASRDNPLLRCPICATEFRMAQALPIHSALFVNQPTAVDPARTNPSAEASRPWPGAKQPPSQAKGLQTLAKFMLGIILVIGIRACPKWLKDRQAEQPPKRQPAPQAVPRPPALDE